MSETTSAAPRGILFILSGPSGVGKDTVLRQALPRLGDIRRSISVTTRDPRPGEEHGKDYFFINQAEFFKLMERGELLEHAAVHAKLYGTPRSWVLEQLHQGTDVVLEIDVQGAVQVKKAYPDAILVFIAPPSWTELARRLRARQTEDEETIRRRLFNARAELARIHQYEYLIVNDEIEETADRLCSVVNAERLRPFRQNISALLAEALGDA